MSAESCGDRIRWSEDITFACARHPLHDGHHATHASWSIAKIGKQMAEWWYFNNPIAGKSYIIDVATADSLTINAQGPI